MESLAVVTSTGRRVSILCDQSKPAYRSSHPQVLSSRDNQSLTSSSLFNTQQSYSVEWQLPDRTRNTDTPYRDLFHRSQIISDSIVTSSSATYPKVLPKGLRITISYRDPLNSHSGPPFGGCAATEIGSEVEVGDKSSSRTTQKSVGRYICHCKKSFSTSGHLSRHKKIHTGEKKFLCPRPDCGARFSRNDNCVQHFKTHKSRENRLLAMKGTEPEVSILQKS
ncbi:transcriptional repressor [Orbilia ellipsospora]|uniref:C2H2 type master regulator of conidiophore development brlA n=1 Tax=Orbilia ellipsospora TaxID=2528407 RepID=A0AAV9WTG7_9PEZI